MAFDELSRAFLLYNGQMLGPLPEPLWRALDGGPRATLPLVELAAAGVSWRPSLVVDWYLPGTWYRHQDGPVGGHYARATAGSPPPARTQAAVEAAGAAGAPEPSFADGAPEGWTNRGTSAVFFWFTDEQHRFEAGMEIAAALAHSPAAVPMLLRAYVDERLAAEGAWAGHSSLRYALLRHALETVDWYAVAYNLHAEAAARLAPATEWPAGDALQAEGLWSAEERPAR